MKCVHCAMIMVVICLILGRIVGQWNAHAAPTAVLLGLVAILGLLEMDDCALHLYCCYYMSLKLFVENVIESTVVVVDFMS